MLYEKAVKINSFQIVYRKKADIVKMLVLIIVLKAQDILVCIL